MTKLAALYLLDVSCIFTARVTGASVNPTYASFRSLDSVVLCDSSADVATGRSLQGQVLPESWSQGHGVQSR